MTISEQQLSTLFWVNVFLSVGIMLVTVAIAQSGRLNGGELFRISGLPMVHLLSGCLRSLLEAHL